MRTPDCTHVLMRDDVEIDPQHLIAVATTARNRAYARYSGYAVGAAVMTSNDEIKAGSNVENAVYPLTMCAERVAIFSAISAGASRIIAVAVVTKNGGSPCGSCRQVMREFGDDAMPVFIADTEGNCRVTTLGTLLPDSFSKKDLSVTTDEP